MSLTALRTDVTAELVAAGIRAVEYVAEDLVGPCAVVVPGQPYIVYPTGTNGLTFGSVLVRVDVLLLVTHEAAKSAAVRIDQLTENALAALSDHDVTQVTRPAVVPIKNVGTFVGCTITIEETTEAP